MTLLALTSRWTRPSRCTASSASHSSEPMCRTSRIFSGPFWCTISASVRPRISSIASPISLPIRWARKMVTTLRCRTRAISCPSRRTLASDPAGRRDKSMILRAISRCSTGSQARWTVPKPPRPICSSSVYSPHGMVLGSRCGCGVSRGARRRRGPGLSVVGQRPGPGAFPICPRHRVEQRLDHGPILLVVAALLEQEFRPLGEGLPRRQLGDRGRTSPLLRRHGVYVSAERQVHSCQVTRMLIDHPVFAPTFYAAGSHDPAAGSSGAVAGRCRAIRSDRLFARALALPRRLYLFRHRRARLRGGVDAAADAAPRSHHRRRQRRGRRVPARTRDRRRDHRTAGDAAVAIAGAVCLRGAGARRRGLRARAAVGTGGADASAAVGVSGRRPRPVVPAGAGAVVSADGPGAGDGPGRDVPARHPLVRRRPGGAGAADRDALRRQHRRGRSGRAGGGLRADSRRSACAERLRWAWPPARCRRWSSSVSRGEARRRRRVAAPTRGRSAKGRSTAAADAPEATTGSDARAPRPWPPWCSPRRDSRRSSTRSRGRGSWRWCSARRPTRSPRRSPP